MDDKRFGIYKQKGSLTAIPTIVVDKVTGVNYLFIDKGCSGGLTPLLDREGKPIISKVGSYDEDLL